jgi:tetratricopeptide (TPR) repeat protein
MMLDQNEVIRLFDDKNYKKVLARCVKGIKRNDSDVFAHFYGGLALLELKRHEEALCHFKKVKRLSPKERYVYLNMGCVYEEMGREDLAIRNYKQEISFFGRSPEANLNLAKLYFRRRSFSKALSYFLACKRLNWCVEEILVDTAFCLNQLGLVNEEISFYKDYLKKHPADVWCLQNLGAALIDVEQYRNATRVLEKAKELGACSPCVCKNLVLAGKGVTMNLERGQKGVRRKVKRKGVSPRI